MKIILKRVVKILVEIVVDYIPVELKQKLLL